MNPGRFKLESDSEKAVSFLCAPPNRSQAKAKVLVVVMLGTKAASGVPSGTAGNGSDERRGKPSGERRSMTGP